MKKLLLFLFIITTSLCKGQNVLISEIADPNDEPNCRFVEIICEGPDPCDMTGLELLRWTNGNSGPTTSTAIPLTSLGTLLPGAIATIANTAVFTSCYGFVPDIIGGTGGPADSNGDDQIAIVNSSSDIIDIFGVPGEDGTGTCHEFEDGRAVRIQSVTMANPVFDESEWQIWADSEIMGCTNHTNQAQDAIDMDPGISALPVELMHFNAASDKDLHVLLSWATASEINNDKFEIQRSLDGYNFETIGEVEGEGNSFSEVNYEFVDETPNNGTNYYRLKQVDLDGKFEYSHVVSAKIDSKKVRIAPTRTYNSINITSENDIEKIVTLVDQSGRTLINSVFNSTSFSIDLSEYPTGMYFLNVIEGTQNTTERVFKL